MAAGQGVVTITDNGDSGLLECPFEGYYGIVLEGTLGGSTTVALKLRFFGSDYWLDVPVPTADDGTAVVFPTNGRSVTVPGNCEVKGVTTNYSGSSGLKLRRTRVSK